MAIIKSRIYHTRMAEIEQLSVEMGCLPVFCSDLTGMGDLIVTATSKHSRNNRCGYLIGQGYEPQNVVKKVGLVAEGINTLLAAMGLAVKNDVELPIITTVDAVINHGGSNERSTQADEMR